MDLRAYHSKLLRIIKGVRKQSHVFAVIGRRSFCNGPLQTVRFANKTELIIVTLLPQTNQTVWEQTNTALRNRFKRQLGAGKTNASGDLIGTEFKASFLRSFHGAHRAGAIFGSTTSERV